MITPRLLGASRPARFRTDRRNDRRRLAASCRPALEQLEGRLLLSFGTPTNYPAGTAPLESAAADFNGDGHADLVVVNQDSNTVSVLLGNGNGTFRPKADYLTGTAPVGVAVGDFNGDSKPDIVVADNGSKAVSVLLNNGNGTFGTKTDITLTSTPFSVLTGDFNNDTKPDIAVATNDGLEDRVSLLISNGDGSFAAPVTYLSDASSGFTPAISFVSTLASGDFNGDSRLDLVVLNNKDYRTPRSGPIYVPGSVSVFLGNGDGTLQAPRILPVGTSPRAVTVGDFSGNGHLDFGVSNAIGGTVSVFLGTGDGSFLLPATYPAADPDSLAAADFTGTGRADLAVVSDTTNTVTVFSGQPGGALQTSATYLIGGRIMAADLNGDGRADLTAVEPLAGVANVWMNTGTGTLLAPRIVPDPGLPLAAQVTADFNGDGIPDLATVNGTAQIEMGLGDGHLGDVQPLGVAGTSFAAADFDGNGTTDLVVGPPDSLTHVVQFLNSPGWDNRTGGAVSLTIAAPPQGIVGTPFSVTVTAVDAAGNPVPAFRGTVDLDIGRPGSSLTLAGQYDFTPADAGRHTFVLPQLTQAGPTTFSAFALGLPNVTTTATFAAAGVTKFGFILPASMTAGVPFAFTLRAEDTFGNVVSGYTGTVHFGATAADTRALLPADYTFLPSDGGLRAFTATLFLPSSATTSPLISASDATRGVSGSASLAIAAQQGDANRDGFVNFQDLLTLAQHYGATNAAWADGDFNGDGTVNFADLLLLAQHYG